MDVSMEFSRPREDLAKPEALPDRPPTPGPEDQPFISTNVSAITANADSTSSSLPPKPFFSVATPPVVESVVQSHQAELTDLGKDSVQHSTVDDSQISAPSTLTNGGTDHISPTEESPSSNSLPQVTSLSLTSIPQPEAATTLSEHQAASTLPISSFDSSVPSSAQILTQDTVTSSALGESIHTLPDLAFSSPKAPISNLRSSPQPVPHDSETAIRIREQNHQQDLAKDPDITLDLAIGDEPADRQSTPQQQDFTTPGLSSLMDTSPNISSTLPVPTAEPTSSVLTPPETAVSDAIAAEFTQQSSAIAVEPDHQPSPVTESFAQPTPTLVESTSLQAQITSPLETIQQPLSAPSAAEVNATTEISPVDHPMMDVSVPLKQSRERDEDDENGPAAKRVKAAEESRDSVFKIPDIPAQSAPSEQSHPSTNDDSITAPRLTLMKKVIGNLKKSSSSKNFREPVDVVKFNIPQYPEIIKQPMDLGTVDRKLKSSVYQKVSEFVSDFQLIVDNAIRFNGMEHTVTQEGLKMRASFENQMSHLPPATLAIPSKEEIKASKVKEQPVRNLQRRASSTQAPPSAGRSPVTPGSAQTFALGPEGLPLIRRDSIAADGRPKRAIHPPKHRDQEFGPRRPLKKKFELELKFCREVLTDLTKPKHYASVQYFLQPVDAVALNIPTYHKFIKKPMDLGTIERKLESNQYEKAKDFEEDVRLVFKNCFTFNPQDDHVYRCGQDAERIFSEKWATKDEWLASHQPVSAQHSGSEDESENEASQDGDDESVDTRDLEIQQLRAQILKMSETVENLGTVPGKKTKKPAPHTASGTKKGKPDKKKKTSLNTGPPPAKEKKKSKTKPEREHFVTYVEKQYISAGITNLPDGRMSEALRIIQNNVPALRNTHETEIELDIDELPNDVLCKLLDFVKKHSQLDPPEPAVPAPSYTAVAESKSKKHKPMSKSRQDQEISDLSRTLGRYTNPTSPSEAPGSKGAESSGEDSGSESSEAE